MGRIVVVRRGALQPLDLEMAFEVGAPVLTTIGGAVSLTAPDLVLQMELGAPVLLSGNVIAANSIEMAVEVGEPVLTTSPFIGIGSATYTPGSGGSGPTLALEGVELTGTTGPYTVFLATHAGATTLTKANITGGTGAAEDHLSFSDADGIVSGEALDLSTSLTGGRLSVFIRDANGVESLVTTIDSVDVDATAPVISAVNMTNITSSTADWEVVSDDAGGTRYVRVRPSGDPAWTTEQILASPDGQA